MDPDIVPGSILSSSRLYHDPRWQQRPVRLALHPWRCYPWYPHGTKEQPRCLASAWPLMVSTASGISTHPGCGMAMNTDMVPGSSSGWYHRVLWWYSNQHLPVVTTMWWQVLAKTLGIPLSLVATWASAQTPAAVCPPVMVLDSNPAPDIILVLSGKEATNINPFFTMLSSSDLLLTTQRNHSLFLSFPFLHHILINHKLPRGCFSSASHQAALLIQAAFVKTLLTLRIK